MPTIAKTNPEIVHVLHRRKAISSGRNISDAHIQSQIDVLNKDFTRLNAISSKIIFSFPKNS